MNTSTGGNFCSECGALLYVGESHLHVCASALRPDIHGPKLDVFHVDPAELVRDPAPLFTETMTFAAYQSLARRTAFYPRDLVAVRILYPALGLCGEAGEVAEHIKKSVRDDRGEITDARREKLTKELGDVLWYLSNLAYEAGISLDQVARENIAKLEARRAASTLSGSGSDR